MKEKSLKIGREQFLKVKHKLINKLFTNLKSVQDESSQQSSTVDDATHLVSSSSGGTIKRLLLMDLPKNTSL